MNVKKSLKDVIVLVAICVVFTLGLALTNSITEPVITKRLNDLANAALLEVMPDGGDFEKVDLSGKTLPATVEEVYEASNGGYVFKLVVNGFKPGMTLMVGVDANGAITGTKCISHQETSGYGTKVVEQYPNVLPGVTEATIDGVDAVAGATVTSNAYKNAMKDVFVAVAILGGKEVDLRTEEQKVADALPAGTAFEKVMIIEPIAGVDRIYKATNGAGYVVVIVDGANEIFVGVGADGVAIGEVSAEHKTTAEGAVVSVEANALTPVDLTEFADHDLFKNYIVAVQKSGNGTFVIDVKGKGYSSDLIVIRVGINANGEIIDLQNISNSESSGFGKDKLEGGYYGDIFVGKNESGAGEVDFDTLKNGSTVTSKGVKQAVENAFNAIKILGGENVDTRTEEQKFADALAEALPAGNGEFTKYFKVEVIEGIDSIYVANNGAGYVCVIGTDSTGTFIGVDANGVALGENENNALAEAAVATIKATTTTDIDFAEYKTNKYDNTIRRAFNGVTSIKKTASGNYIIEMSAKGYGSSGEHGASGKPIIVRVCVGADGTILDAQTISEAETPNLGGALLQDGSYNSNFIGKNQEEANGVDTIAGTTLTTKAFKNCIVYSFTVFTTLEGGAN